MSDRPPLDGSCGATRERRREMAAVWRRRLEALGRHINPSKKLLRIIFQPIWVTYRYHSV